MKTLINLLRVWWLNKQIAEASQRMCQCYNKGDHDQARTIQRRFYRLIKQRNVLTWSNTK